MAETEESEAVQRRRESIRKQLGLAVLDTELDLPPPVPQSRKDIELNLEMDGPSPRESPDESLQSVSQTSGRPSRRSRTRDPDDELGEPGRQLRESIQRVINPLRTIDDLEEDSQFRREESSSSSGPRPNERRKSSANSASLQMTDTPTP